MPHLNQLKCGCFDLSCQLKSTYQNLKGQVSGNANPIRRARGPTGATTLEHAMSQDPVSNTARSVDLGRGMTKPDPHTSLPDLRRMLAAIGVEKFFADYWQRQSLATQLAEADFAQIMEEIGPLDIARFAGAAKEGTRAWVANEYVAHSVIPVDALNAQKLFDIGATIYFMDVPLDRLTNGLADFLGVPRQKIIASIFLTPSNGGAAPHFDKNENFTVQLTGKKQWTVSNIPMVVAPPDGYMLGQPIPPSLKTLLDPAMELTSRIIEMQAGTMLYVPRGTVHYTSAGETSWSLNLSYNPPMWIDLIRIGLQRRLISSARWRGTITGVADTCDVAARQSNLLYELIAEMREVLSDPAEIRQLCKDFFNQPDG
jgi:ribosomal protein L16 Arg81 hydroxylase